MKSVIQAVFVLLASLSVSGCATTVNSEFRLASADRAQQRNIFVFLDGTANESASGTNVYRTFELISRDDNPTVASIYIEGVGTAGANVQQVVEAALGYGMQDRILAGYQFVTENYRFGDKIYILGFSRGAHEARALAGLLSYAGIPVSRPTSGKKILSLVQAKDDDDYLQHWQDWKKGDRPLLADEIKRSLNLDVQSVEINFLGLWDTVPGSSLKKFGKCKEEKDSKDGDRYKSGSYPPIRYIAHAVSVDEKRSKFRPILLCDAMNPELTTLAEVWFPGAHADVGGGYGDARGLSGISLNWMLENLAKDYRLKASTLSIEANSMDTAHWSVGDPYANYKSLCEDRIPGEGAIFHASVAERRTSGRAPLRMFGQVKTLTYPFTCKDAADLLRVAEK